MSIFRRDDTVQDATGRALAGALVYYLTQPADVSALTPLAPVYQDTEGDAAANPQTTDGFGHAVAYLAEGQLYTIVYTHPLIGQVVYPDQSVGSTGGSANIFSQVPSGAINGTNTVFTLSHAPVQLFFYWNGNFQTPGLDYNLSGVTITMARAPQPASGSDPGDTLYAQGTF